ncbi:MAG: hypothetical protein MCS20_02155, partial [Candidatus Phytoplasma mali]|nr:hypothetical protein [Candidatus Phytoplasma australiense]MCG7202192.1 hypothetical protein [Candidatus Phytoplasma mali]MCZ8632944.1 hypothetical protein [Spiroplasma sp. Tabriz.8]
MNENAFDFKGLFLLDCNSHFTTFKILGFHLYIYIYIYICIPFYLYTHIQFFYKPKPFFFVVFFF